MSQLGPFMGQMGGGAPVADGGAQQPAGEAAAAPDAAPEEPAEKTHYDVELESFDAATKIKLIKEVRGILGLGLKEAKETVESAPSWLSKDLKKEEAEALKEKLEAQGGKVRLV